MDTRVRNFLGVVIGLAVLGVGYSALWYTQAYSTSIQPSSFRSFSVSGEGKVVAVPDVAATTFSTVTEGGKDLAALQKENTDKINKAIAFLKSKGIDAKDIKTSQYSVEPRYQNYNCFPPATVNNGVQPCPPAEIVGYTISQSVTIKIRKFEVIGDVLSGVVDNGANRVSGVSFTIDDPTKVQNDARAEAITKAKEKARAIADAGGFSLGRLLSIDEGSQPIYYDRAMDAFKERSTAAAAPSPTIEAGSQDVTVTVSLRYEIK